MFKKKCPKCREKIEKGYQFCPFCGHNLKSKYEQEDYGFLGRNDFEDSFDSMFNDLPMNKIFKTAMKMTEKMIKNMQESNQPRHSNNTDSNIQFFINGKRVFSQKKQVQQDQKPKKITPRISKDKLHKLSKLPRKEPKTVMKRLSGKLVYELEVPGVEDINDVLINQLESSIEIKAISKNKVYSKILNVNLPIIRYGLDEDNLVLELQAR